MFNRWFSRLVPLLALIAQVVLWVVATTTIGSIEGPYPTHFDASGQPDKFGEGNHWILPVVGLAMILTAIFVVAGSRRLAVSHPGFVNIPRKIHWMRLPVENRLRALEPLSSLAYGLALFANLLFISVVLDIYSVATGAMTRLPETKVFIAVGGMIVWIVLSMLRLKQAVGDEVRLVRRGEIEASQSQASQA